MSESRLSITIDSRSAEQQAKDLAVVLDAATKAGINVSVAAEKAGKATAGAGTQFSKAGKEAGAGADGVGKLGKSMDEARSNAMSLRGALIGAFAGVSIAGAFGKIIAETNKAEQEQAQLAAVLKSTGQAAGFNRDQLNEMAGAMSLASTVSSGEISQAQTTLLAFTGVVGTQFTEALQAAIDMSARTGMSVVSATETIGRALDVPSQGLSALSRQGFQFSDGQKKLAKQLEDTGRTAEAQGIVLEALKQSYGGAAAAARDTFGGSITGLRNQLGDLMSGGDGSLDEAKNGVNELARTLASEETKQAFASFVSMVTGATNILVNFAAASRNGWPGMIASLEAGAGKSRDVAKEMQNLRQEIEEMESAAAKSGGVNRWIFDKGIQYRKGRLAALRDQLSEEFSGMFPAETPTLDPVVVTPNGGGNGGGKQVKATTSELERYLKVLREQAAVLGMTELEASRYRVGMMDGSRLQKKEALALLDSNHAYKENIALSRERLNLARELSIFESQENLPVTSMGLGDRRRDLFEQEYAIREEYARRRSRLDEAQESESTRISQEALERRKSLLEEAEEAKIKIIRDASERKLIAEQNWVIGAQEAWTNYVDSASNTYQNSATATNAILNDMQSSVSSGLQGLITQTQSVEDGFRSMATGMADSVISALSDMAAQWLIYQGVQLLVGKTAQSSSIASMTANASAASLMAGLNAFSSTAAIPITGPALAPAAMAAALAATSPMVMAVTSAATTGLTGMAHNGIDAVPREGTWLLDKGERVLSAKQNSDLTNYLKGSGATSSAARGDITIQVVVNAETGHVGVSGADDQQMRQLGTMIAASARKVIIEEMRPHGLLDRNR